MVCVQLSAEDVYSAVCEYAIVRQCDPTPAGLVTAFPLCSQTSWGVANATAARYGLEPLQCGAVFQTSDDGQCELGLRLIANRHGLRFTSRLTTRDGRGARTIEGAVVSRVIGDVATFTFWYVSVFSTSFAHCPRISFDCFVEFFSCLLFF